ncbi:hypothetical protein [Planctomicrobium piriforme]|uniref:Uncharacterized protein n=1 Tax=Planctomicrobium piriforme TaxID=1576369 RepID=A0A1I3QIK0_9PLAN|nr:hypothetical protein [Planctomicrobium piriforme]SFJ33359.1 hypothetical protein SAMN05421753_11892 [Planctomicrobium piriforme]
MAGFQPTPEQLRAAREGVRSVATTPEQDEYLKHAQAEEEAAHLADPQWNTGSMLAAFSKRLKNLEAQVKSLQAEIHELRAR